jgi:hypothetical protein
MSTVDFTDEERAAARRVLAEERTPARAAQVGVRGSLCRELAAQRQGAVFVSSQPTDNLGEF